MEFGKRCSSPEVTRRAGQCFSIFQSRRQVGRIAPLSLRYSRPAPPVLSSFTPAARSFTA